MINKIFSVFSKTVNYKDNLSKIKVIGVLYKKVIGSKQVMIGEDCGMDMSIKDEKTFSYSLNITNEDYQVNKDTWNTLSFDITNESGFKFCKEEGQEMLVWENRNHEFFIFTFFRENGPLIEEFIKYLGILLTSYENEQDLATASAQLKKGDFITNLDEVENIDLFLEENYSQIYGKPQQIPVQSNKINVNSEQIIHINEIADDFNKLKVSKQLYFRKTFPSAVLLFEAKGHFNKYDREKDELQLVSSNAKFSIFKVESFQYYLVVDEQNMEITHSCTVISQDINLILNRLENLVMWIGKDSSIGQNAYNFVFSNEGLLDTLRRVVAKVQYESSSLSKYEELKEDERDYLENENMPDEYEDDGENYDIEMNLDNEYQESDSELLNKATAQAYLHDRTFVVRDNNTIGVYKTDDEDVLSHLANLPAVVKYEEKDIDIKNAQMFYSDTNLLLLDKKNANTAYRYDLGKGKIVEEWTAEGMKSIDSITQQRKFDQMTDNEVVIGMNNNNIFTMDARINKKDKVVNSKSYKTNPKMNCLVTTDFGGIATGSATGEIRLYDQIGKNAKTLLQTFGDKFSSLDVTSDGKYVLATCEKYLVLLPTSCKGDKNGFTTQMGKEKPNPKTLKIKPNDINKYGLENLKFTPARFNVDRMNGETNIITSIGEFVVIWNFSKIKKGILDDYKIKKVNQTVLENQFKYNRNQIVVTMQNKIRIQNQKKLFE